MPRSWVIAVPDVSVVWEIRVQINKQRIITLSSSSTTNNNNNNTYNSNNSKQQQ